MDDSSKTTGAATDPAPRQRTRRAGRVFENLHAGAVVVGCLGAAAVAFRGSMWGVGVGLLGLTGVALSFLGPAAGRAGR
jgi:hypothetical protein